MANCHKHVSPSAEYPVTVVIKKEDKEREKKSKHLHLDATKSDDLGLQLRLGLHISNYAWYTACNSRRLTPFTDISQSGYSHPSIPLR